MESKNMSNENVKIIELKPGEKYTYRIKESERLVVVNPSSKNPRYFDRDEFNKLGYKVKTHARKVDELEVLWEKKEKEIDDDLKKQVQDQDYQNLKDLVSLTLEKDTQENIVFDTYQELLKETPPLIINPSGELKIGRDFIRRDYRKYKITIESDGYSLKIIEYQTYHPFIKRGLRVGPVLPSDFKLLVKKEGDVVYIENQSPERTIYLNRIKL